MKKAVILSGLIALTAIGALSLPIAQAEEAPAVKASLKPGTFNLSFDGKTFTGKVDNGSSDFVKHFTTSINSAARFRDSDVSTALFTLEIAGDKVQASDIKLWLREKKGYFSSSTARSPLKATLVKVEPRGEKLFAAGKIEGTLFHTDVPTSEPQGDRTREVTIEFALEFSAIQ